MHLETGILDFWQDKKAEKLVVFISDVGICGIYLSLTLGTAKFELLELSCSFNVIKNNKKKLVFV